MGKKEENRGWIKLHRSIQNHWLWDLEDEPFDRRSAFIDLLMLANHARRKVFFKNEIIYVERGQTITSIRKLCEKWNWSNTKVNNFLNLLESDGVIVMEKDTKKTVITICNYNKYQFMEEGTNDAQATDKRHLSDEQKTNGHTNKNFKNLAPPPPGRADYKAKFVALYFDVFGTMMNPFHYKTLENYIELHGFEEDAVCLALKEAGENGADNFKYVITILNEWNNKGAKTLSDCKAILNRHESRRVNAASRGGKASGFSGGNSTDEEFIEDESVFNE